MDQLAKEYETYDVEETLNVFKTYLSEVDVVLLPNGKGNNRQKTIALYLLAISKGVCYYLGASEKVKALKPLQSKIEAIDGIQKWKFVLIERGDDLQKSVDEFLDRIQQDLGSPFKKFGIIESEKSQQGKLTEAYENRIKQKWADIESVDVTETIVEVISKRRNGDEKMFRSSSHILKHCFEIANKFVFEAIEGNEKVTNKSIADKILERFETQSKDIAATLNIRENFFDMPLDPSIQSGGNIVTKQFIESSDKTFMKTNCTVSLATQYFDFNVQAIRTSLVNPSASLASDFQVIKDAFTNLKQGLRPGLILKEVFSEILAQVVSKRPAWDTKLSSNFGAGIGLQLKETNRIINAKCSSKVEVGDVFFVMMGVKEILTKDGEKSGFLLGDTIRVGETANEVLTKDIQWKSIVEIHHQAKKRASPKNPDALVQGDQPVIKTRLQKQQEGNTSKVLVSESLQVFKRLQDHQKELLALKQNEMRERLRNGEFILPGSKQ